MATHDLTRSAHDPTRHYSGVRMQQGRVLTDDDFNVARRIEEDDRRRTRLHVIGPAGSSDDGFRVRSPVADAGADGDRVDFEIAAGTFYLGGHRLEREAAETFRLQRDWLRNPGIEAPAAERRDLVLLHCWEQGVSAVEDEEILEPALGGPDTSSRSRLMTRVEVIPGVAADGCDEAFEAYLAARADAGLGAYGPYADVVPDTTLTVGFSEAGPAPDLCSPQAVGGFLGAENQAIRVQLVDAGHLTWGFDNAAPLYRARLSADGAVLTLDTEPADEAHHPLAGTVVEVLPWGAVLPNGEKLADELAGGHLSRVAASYDPDSRQIGLTTPVPAGFGEEWKERDDAGQVGSARYGQIASQDPYVFLRVWNRGEDLESPPAVPFAAEPVPLGTTGLTVTVGGTDRLPGDHWILAARPETPDLVSPWELSVGRRPEGFRRFVVPLAFLRWTATTDGFAAQVDDCRPSFLPLTRQTSGSGGCCRFSVGDGMESHGDFTRIQDAVDALPPEGGEVCVLPGTYREAVLLDGRRDVTIHGCGRRVRLEAPAPAGGEAPAPALTLKDSQRIRVRALTVAAERGRAVELVHTPAAAGDPEGSGLEDVELAGLFLEARDAAAVHGDGGRRITVTGCRVSLAALVPEGEAETTPDPVPALFLAGEDLAVEGNHLEAENSVSYLFTPGGGLQIGGGSRRVVVRDNRIVRGRGHGIALGSVSEGSGGAPISDGHLYEVRIEGNHITEMAGSGIASARFFDLSVEPILLSVHRLEVVGNEIIGCLALGAGAHPKVLRFLAAHGGVALADVTDAAFRGNRIEDNGTSHAQPVCGLFALHAQGIAVEGNRITGNGPRAQGGASTVPGARGGIVLPCVVPPSSPELLDFGGERSTERTADLPAARITGNVVTATTGRALEMMALGTAHVADNHLTAMGDEAIAGYALPGVAHPPGSITFQDVGELPVDTVRQAERPYRAVLDVFSGTGAAVVGLGLPTDFYLDVQSFRFLRRIQEVKPDLRGTPLSGGERRLPGSALFFTGNHGRFDGLQPATEMWMSAHLLLSLDAVQAEGNQLFCDLDDRHLRTNLLALSGATVRAGGNRLAETLGQPVYSLISYAMANNSTDNQGSHCFTTPGAVTVLTNTSNNVSIADWDSLHCSALGDSWAF